MRAQTTFCIVFTVVLFIVASGRSGRSLPQGMRCKLAATGQPSPWEIIPLDSLVKAFPDGSIGGADEFPLDPTFNAIGGQPVSIQLVLKRDVGQVQLPDLVETVDISEIGEAATLISNASWYVVGYINVPQPSNPQNRPGWFPDPLTPIFEGFTSIANNSAFKKIEEQSAWPLWVRMTAANIPKDSSGSIAFSVKFRQNDGQAVECSTSEQPIGVRVVPRPSPAATQTDDAPDTLHQLTDCHAQGTALEYAQPGGFKGNTTGSFMHAVAAMASHGINSLEYQGDWRPVLNATLAGGNCDAANPTYEFHLEGYFAQMREILATTSIRRFHLPLPMSLHHETHFVTTNATAFIWSDGPPDGVCHIPLLDPPVDGSTPLLTRQFKAHWTALAGSLWTQLTAQSWFKEVEFSYFVVDEPEWNDNCTASATLQMMQLASSLLDGVTIWQDRWPVAPVAPLDPEVERQLVDTVDTWCVHVNQWSTPGVPRQLAEQRKAGKTITIYDNGMMFVDMPWTRIRTQAWMIWRSDSGVDEARTGVQRGLGLRGSLSWYDANSWRGPDGRYKSPWTGLQQYHNTSGFGVQLYPPLHDDSVPPSQSSLTAGVAVLPSIRHEHLWLGIEDAEALYLLQEAQDDEQKLALNAQQQQYDISGAYHPRAVFPAAPAIPAEVLATVWNFTVQWNVQHLQPPIPNDGYTTNVTLLREAQRKVVSLLA